MQVQETLLDGCLVPLHNLDLDFAREESSVAVSAWLVVELHVDHET